MILFLCLPKTSSTWSALQSPVTWTGVPFAIRAAGVCVLGVLGSGRPRGGVCQVVIWGPCAPPGSKSWIPVLGCCGKADVGSAPLPSPNKDGSSLWRTVLTAPQAGHVTGPRHDLQRMGIWKEERRKNIDRIHALGQLFYIFVFLTLPNHFVRYKMLPPSNDEKTEALPRCISCLRSCSQ